MNRTLLLTLLIVFVTACPAASLALPSDVDGDLSDWGLRRSGGEWIVDDGITYTVENSTRVRSDGGAIAQQFDAEGMGAFYSDEDGILYVTVVTGTPPSGAVYSGNTYASGDLAIDFNGDGTYEFGIETTGNGQFAKGTVVRTSPGDWSAPVDSNKSTPASLAGGSAVGISPIDIEYNNNDGAYGRHYVIEMAVPVEAFGPLWGDPFTLSWTMESGTDVISLNHPANNNDSPVPEPATILLLCAGLIGIAALLRRKKVAA